jgi:hypothetical protein
MRRLGRCEVMGRGKGKRVKAKGEREKAKGKRRKGRK